MSHIHTYRVHAIKLTSFDYRIGDFLLKRLWRRCDVCGKREQLNVSASLKDKEIRMLYEGAENETFH